MKKKILSALLLTILGYCASSQNLKNNATNGNPEVSNLRPGSEIRKHVVPIYSNDISAKAIRNFKTVYKDIEGESWYKMPDGYRANFIDRGISYTLSYNKRGNWLNTIKRYDEKKLPVEIQHLVITSYPDFTIRSLEEIEMPHNTVLYIIHLEGQTKWINIRVCNSEIVELETLKKSS
jgi:hypothetical protein